MITNCKQTPPFSLNLKYLANYVWQKIKVKFLKLPTYLLCLDDTIWRFVGCIGDCQVMFNRQIAKIRICLGLVYELRSGLGLINKVFVVALEVLPTNCLKSHSVRV